MQIELLSLKNDANEDLAGGGELRKVPGKEQRKKGSRQTENKPWLSLRQESSNDFISWKQRRELRQEVKDE